MQVRTWFIPSFYGDIRLEATADDRTTLIAEALTPLEAEALRSLRDAHCEDGVIAKAWATREEWNTTGIEGEKGDPFRSNGAHTILLRAPVKRVESALTKLLKPDRKFVRAVCFKSGTAEREIVSAEAAENKPEPSPAAKPEPKPVGASVAEPVRGCPLPDFATVNVRATRVLKAFLTPRQAADFERVQQFIVEAVDTGTRYMLTSRLAGDRFRRMGGSVFNMDTGCPVCVHDWSVPAAEELLALLACFSMAGGETHMLRLPVHA